MRQRVSRRRAGAAIFAIAVWLLPASPATATGTFEDDDGNVHEAAIEAIASQGITLGCQEDLYCPERVVTRGQMASFLQRALDLPPGTDVFTDDAGSVHEEAINAIARAGITLGCDSSGTRFCPARPLTRAQMASLLVRSFAFPASSADFFVDDEASVHEEAINAIAAAAITAGCDESGTRFCPGQAVRRDQMASFLARSLGLLETGPFSCTRVVGFSQTEQWFTGGGFEPVAGDAEWELLWEPGSTIEKWADPDFVGWSNPVVSACAAGSFRPADAHRDRRRTVGGDAGSRTSPLRSPPPWPNTRVRRSSSNRSSAVPTSSYARACAEKACVPRSTIQSSTRRSA